MADPTKNPRREDELFTMYVDSEGAIEKLKKIDDLHKLCELAQTAKIKLEAITKVKAEYQKIFDYLRHGAIPTKMDEEGIDTVTYEDVGKITLTGDIRASIPAPQRKAAYEWLVSEGHEGLIQETVNSSTLKAFVKSQIREGKEFPEELFSIRPFTRANIPSEVK